MIEPASRTLGVADDEILSTLGGEPLLALIEDRCTEEEYWKAVLDRSGWDTTVRELGELARESFRQVVPGMPELLAKLKEYPLVLFSDHAREWMAYINQHHYFLEIFNRRFISFEMKRTKRTPETFHYMAAELNREPGSCIFVDDLQRNVERAAKVVKA